MRTVYKIQWETLLMSQLALYESFWSYFALVNSNKTWQQRCSFMIAFRFLEIIKHLSVGWFKIYVSNLKVSDYVSTNDVRAVENHSLHTLWLDSSVVSQCWQCSADIKTLYHAVVLLFSVWDRNRMVTNKGRKEVAPKFSSCMTIEHGLNLSLDLCKNRITMWSCYLSNILYC